MIYKAERTKTTGNIGFESIVTLRDSGGGATEFPYKSHDWMYSYSQKQSSSDDKRHSDHIIPTIGFCKTDTDKLRQVNFGCIFTQKTCNRIAPQRKIATAVKGDHDSRQT